MSSVSSRPLATKHNGAAYALAEYVHINFIISSTSRQDTRTGVRIGSGVTKEDKDGAGQVKVDTREADTTVTRDTLVRKERDTSTQEETAATVDMTDTLA